MQAQYEQFSDALISLVKNWRAALDARLRPLGMSQARWQVLFKLSRAEAPLTQCDLAQRIGIEPASLVRLLDVLQQEGLVTRSTDPQDRRAKLVTLTDQGQALGRRLTGEAEALRAEMLSTFSPEELQHATGVLQRLQERAHRLAGPGDCAGK